MEIHSVTEIYFSPTGSTKKVVNAITKGMGDLKKESINMTLPQVREKKNPVIHGDIVIIGVPVYAVRVPKLLHEFLMSLHGGGKPVVIVGVYGNASDGIVLNELEYITSQAGFKVVAGATFVGQHSFATKNAPLAKGHPNENDLKMANEFGKAIIKKLEKRKDLKHISLKMPKGKVPVEAKILPDSVSKMVTRVPEVDPAVCSHCNVCAKLCPVGAIDSQTLKINKDACIRCFSCVRRCPKKARKIVYRPDFVVTKVLSSKNKVEKKPKLYYSF